MRKTSENVANFIFCTNNAFPVKIEAGDRRYVVLSASGIHKNDHEYWSQLYKSFTKEFYESLTAFFTERDITSFNPRIIPMTEAKEDLIEASRSPIDVWICEHYDELLNGIQCSDALVSKPSEMKDKNFQLQIKEKCERKKKGPKGNQKWYYILKDECKSLYHQTVYEEYEEE